MKCIVRGYALAALLFALPAAAAEAGDDPRVPPGLDPGGMAIALITDGVDYTDAEIAARLARDGEGEPIALDLVDGDVRPYAPPDQGRGTQLAKRILSVYRHSRLVIVRADAADPASMAKSAMFVARTPARIAALGYWARQREDWAPFAEAVTGVANVLFIVPGGNGPSRSEGAAFPAGFKRDNVLVAAAFTSSNDHYAPAIGDENVDAWVVEPGATMFGGGRLNAPKDSIEAVALLAGNAACAMHGRKDSTPADVAMLKAALLSLAREITIGSTSTSKVHDPMCWYGGVRFGGADRF